MRDPNIAGECRTSGPEGAKGHRNLALTPRRTIEPFAYTAERTRIYTRMHTQCALELERGGIDACCGLPFLQNPLFSLISRVRPAGQRTSARAPHVCVPRGFFVYGTDALVLLRERILEGARDARGCGPPPTSGVTRDTPGSHPHIHLFCPGQPHNLAFARVCGFAGARSRIVTGEV